MRPFIKFISPAGYDFGEDQPPAMILKRSSRGLRGTDLDVFIKRAGHSLLERVRQLHGYPGEELVHLIALGSTEFHGPNRNGDGFKVACLRKYHPTFVKHARFYRSHANQDPSRSYGVVKLSHYNEDMHRVELIVGLNATKEAADRNKGLVADKEMDKLASDESSLAVSMACRVPQDVCSGCDNRARSRDEYCTDQGCDYGGLKYNIGKVAEDGHILHADNPDPTFFDISHVWRPADRIAYVLGRVKQADGRVKSGAEMAEEAGSPCPEDIVLIDTPIGVRDQVKVAYRLAEIELLYRRSPQMRSDPVNRALRRSMEKAASLPAGEPVRRAWQALSDMCVMLPLDRFLEIQPQGVLTKLSSVSVRRVRAHLPGVFNRVLSEPNLEDMLTANPYRPGPIGPSEEMREWAYKQAAACGLGQKQVINRTYQSIIDEEKEPKWASDQSVIDIESDRLARQYALYQIGFLAERASSPDLARLCDLAVRSNHLEG